MDLRPHQRNVNCLGKELQYMGNTILIKDKKSLYETTER